MNKPNFNPCPYCEGNFFAFEIDKSCSLSDEEQALKDPIYDASIVCSCGGVKIEELGY